MKKLLILSTALYFFSNAGSALAASTPVISEVYPAPVTGESEWVELYNPTATSLVLSGFQLKDQLATPAVIYTFTDQVIPAYSYLAVDIAGSKLNNTGDGVTILDSSGQAVDEMTYSSSQSGKSWQRVSLEATEFVLSNPTKDTASSEYPLLVATPTPSPTPTPTPVPTASPSPTATPLPTASPSVTPTPSPTPTPLPLPTATPTPTPSPSATPTPSPSPSPSPQPADLSTLRLSEVMACPSSGNEWLELYNSSNAPVSVSQLKMTDAAGNTRLLSGTVPAKGWEVFSWMGNVLNNTGDSLTLTSSSGQVVGSMEYSKCQNGMSLVAVTQGGTTEWLTTTATPGAENILPETEEDDEQEGGAPVVVNPANPVLPDSSNALNALGKNTLFPILPPTASSNPLVLGSVLTDQVRQLFHLPDLPSHTPNDVTPQEERFIIKNDPPPKKLILGGILSGLTSISSSLGQLYGKKLTELIASIT